MIAIDTTGSSEQVLDAISEEKRQERARKKASKKARDERRRRLKGKITVTNS